MAGLHEEDHRQADAPVPSNPAPGDVPAHRLKQLCQDAQDVALEAPLAKQDGCPR
jgi:hypothetical protein